MTSRIILHIGTHKTATTTIQNTFAANRALLARHGLDYPTLNAVPGHHGLAMKWLCLPDVYALPGGAEAGWARVGALAQAGRTVFLSSEEFSRGLPAPGVDLAELRGFLAPFDEVRVLCTLRDQLSYLQSIYLELSKKSAPPPWARFLAGALETGFGAGLFLDFNALDDHLRSAFGREEIRYIDFTTARAGEGGVLGAVLAASGVALGAEALRQADGGRANVSPDPLAAWAANQIAMPGVAPAGLLALVEGALAEERGARRSTLYTREEEARLLARFAPLNARFSERIAASVPGFAVTAPAGGGGRLYRDDLGPGFWLRIARRLHGGRDLAA